MDSENIFGRPVPPTPQQALAAKKASIVRQMVEIAAARETEEIDPVTHAKLAELQSQLDQLL